MLQSKIDSSGLKISDIEEIHSVFKLHPEIHKVLLFGSRAKGNFKPYSDIDLALIGNALNLTILQQIENELDDLLLPYRIDILIYHDIKNDELIEHIKRIGKDFYISSSLQL